MTATLAIAGKRLSLDPPLLMGVLNVTPDSFSDGGQYRRLDAALARARRMVEEGADIIDIGGESTRPGAPPVPADEEAARILPVIEALRPEIDVPISIDTSKPAIMRAAVAAGASLINDVNALRAPGAIEAVAGLDVAVCLMHMQGQPRTMQDRPHYDDVVAEVKAFLAGRLAVCREAGIAQDRILLDPGFGFGKNLEHNIALLAGLGSFRSLGCPLLVGMSRKSMIGALTGRAPGERLHGGVALAAIAVVNGAAVVRTHDVAETRDALRVGAALRATQAES